MKKKIVAILMVLALFVSLTAFITPSALATARETSDPSAGEAARRQAVVDYMHAMARIEWTPAQDLYYTGCSCGHSSTFYAGTTYYGLPYTHKCGSVERMASYLSGGVLTLPEGYAYDEGFNGFDYLIGNDCADAVYWAWAQISDDISFTFSYNMLYDPAVKPVGGYSFVKKFAKPQTNGTSIADTFNALNDSVGAQGVYEIYAQIRMGDGVLKNGHAMLAVGDAVVVRNADGTINPQQSYVTITDQANRALTAENGYSSWGYQKAWTFKELYEKKHIPVTIDAFTEGTAQGVASLVKSGTTADGLPLGTVTSNYRINYVTVEIYDADSQQVSTNSVYPCTGSHNTQYTIVAEDLYDGITLTAGQTWKIFVNGGSEPVEAIDRATVPHEDHCVCAGAANGIGNHSNCAAAGWSAWTSTTTLPASDNYYLTGNVNLSAIHAFTGDANICLNGYGIYGPASGGVINLNKAITAGICDCSTSETGKIVAMNTNSANTAASWSGQVFDITVASYTLNLYSGTLTMDANAVQGNAGMIHSNVTGTINIYDAVLTEGRAAYGASMVMRGGANNTTVINMYGGEISDGRVTGYGGNFYLNAYVTFNLYDGVISDGYVAGTAVSTSQANGGNFVINSSATSTVLNIYGGLITGGSALNYGGNIYLYSGTVNMTDGGITNGICRNANSFGGNLSVGGAGSSGYGTLNMSGGIITGGEIYGKTTVTSAPYGDGAGIAAFKANLCTLNISGTAKIYGNHVSPGTAYQRESNIRLNGDTINIGTTINGVTVSTLEPGARIDLFTSDPTVGKVIATNVTADQIQYFRYHDDAWEFAVNANGQLVLTVIIEEYVEWSWEENVSADPVFDGSEVYFPVNNPEGDPDA